MRKIKRISLRTSSSVLSSYEMKSIRGANRPTCDAQAKVCTGDSCVTGAGTLGYCDWYYLSSDIRLCSCIGYPIKSD